MLVISRKTEEFLQIGDNIIVKVIRSSNGSVKIGIQAPGELRIVRGELQEQSAELPKALGRSRSRSRCELADKEALQAAEAL